MEPTSAISSVRHWAVDEKKNDGLFKTGERTLHLAPIFEESISHTKDAEATTLEKIITVDKRKTRIAGFFLETLGVAFSPLAGLTYISFVKPSIVQEGHMYAFVLGVLPATVLSIFTLMSSPVFFLARTIHYACTHCTVEVGEKKYYVKTADYKKFLHDQLNVAENDLKTTKALKAFKLLDKTRDLSNVHFEEIAKAHTALNDWNNELNPALELAFQENSFKEMHRLILLGANPYLLLFKGDPEGDYTVGLLYQMIKQNPSISQDRQDLLQMLEERLPQEAKSEKLLELKKPEELKAYTELREECTQENPPGILIGEMIEKGDQHLFKHTTYIPLSSLCENFGPETNIKNTPDIKLATYQSGTLANFLKKDGLQKIEPHLKS